VTEFEQESIVKSELKNVVISKEVDNLSGNNYNAFTCLVVLEIHRLYILLDQQLFCQLAVFFLFAASRSVHHVKLYVELIRIRQAQNAKTTSVF
jgi:hypothetical protein